MAGECPKCGYANTTVTNSRRSRVPDVIVTRRRSYWNCEAKFTTHEVVVNKDSPAHLVNNRANSLKFLKGVEDLARDLFGDSNGNMFRLDGRK
jgi:transcriptional regulator NrdR family protein